MKKFTFKTSILYEDADYLIVNKPPKIPSLADRQQNHLNMLSYAKNYCKDIKICHRLDKDTSGVLIFAKHKNSQRELTRQFMYRQVNKEYHAISVGSHNFHEETVRGAILTNKTNTAKIDTRKGKKAKTLIYTLKIFNGYSFLKFVPLTGRTHQIRLHASLKKASLVGDLKYGGKDIYLSQLKKSYKSKDYVEELPIIRRVALHAYKIQFTAFDKEIKVEAPYPKDFLILLKQLERYACL